MLGKNNASVTKEGRHLVASKYSHDLTLSYILIPVTLIFNGFRLVAVFHIVQDLDSVPLMMYSPISCESIERNEFPNSFM